MATRLNVPLGSGAYEKKSLYKCLIVPYLIVHSSFYTVHVTGLPSCFTHCDGGSFNQNDMVLVLYLNIVIWVWEMDSCAADKIESRSKAKSCNILGKGKQGMHDGEDKWTLWGRQFLQASFLVRRLVTGVWIWARRDTLSPEETPSSGLRRRALL